jgi:hypothetical protein
MSCAPATETLTNASPVADFPGTIIAGSRKSRNSLAGSGACHAARIWQSTPCASPQPRPPLRPVLLLLRGQRSRPITEFMRMPRQLVGLGPAVRHSQRPCAERLRFRRLFPGPAVSLPLSKFTTEQSRPLAADTAMSTGERPKTGILAPETTPTAPTATGAAGPHPASSKGGTRTVRAKPKRMPRSLSPKGKQTLGAARETPPWATPFAPARRRRYGPPP